MEEDEFCVIVGVLHFSVSEEILILSPERELGQRGLVFKEGLKQCEGKK